MPEFVVITPEQAMEQFKAQASFVDIRDPGAYAEGHIAGASNVGNDNLADFVASTDKSNALVVYCYHGISSQQAARYFTDQGFEQVMSIDGGFEAWRQDYPVAS